MLAGSPILAEFGIQKESRKEFENEKQKLPNVEIHNEMPVRTQPCISKQMCEQPCHHYFVFEY
uniref:Uncharacterized protein n=1 Tax=Salix viminalis TaxID=40686 RepID=A0A6N2NFQ6_SALVM